MTAAVIVSLAEAPPILGMQGRRGTRRGYASGPVKPSHRSHRESMYACGSSESGTTRCLVTPVSFDKHK